eukprot:scaffold56570_cov55-Phaeocystis_antarctica.AAC.1
MPRQEGALHRKCFNCGKPGHLSADCTQPQGNTACYECGQPGHKVRRPAYGPLPAQRVRLAPAPGRARAQRGRPTPALSLCLARSPRPVPKPTFPYPYPGARVPERATIDTLRGPSSAQHTERSLPGAAASQSECPTRRAWLPCVWFWML